MRKLLRKFFDLFDSEPSGTVISGILMAAVIILAMEIFVEDPGKVARCTDLPQCPQQRYVEDCNEELWLYDDGTVYQDGTPAKDRITRKRACVTIEPNDRRNFTETFGVGTTVCWDMEQKRK